jgi:hypothetical protein
MANGLVDSFRVLLFDYSDYFLPYLQDVGFFVNDDIPVVFTVDHALEIQHISSGIVLEFERKYRLITAISSSIPILPIKTSEQQQEEELEKQINSARGSLIININTEHVPWPASESICRCIELWGDTYDGSLLDTEAGKQATDDAVNFSIIVHVG